MVFSALAETSSRKSVHAATENTLKSIKLAILKVISWKLTMIHLRKVAEFYRRLYGGGGGGWGGRGVGGGTFLPSNLSSYLNSRTFFQHRWRIFAYCSVSKIKKAVAGFSEPHVQSSRSHLVSWAIFCVLRKLIFAIRTDWFALIFAIFRKYPVPSIDKFLFLLSTCNRNTYFQTRALCKTSNSLYTVLFLNERGKL